MLREKSFRHYDKRAARRLFSKEEDEKIRELVRVYGTKSWGRVSNEMRRRTSRQCRERWKNYLDPDVKNGPWAVEEDELLRDYVIQYGTQWAKIAGFFEHRTDTNVKNRWVLLQRNSHRKTLNLIESSPNEENIYNVQDMLSNKGAVDPVDAEDSKNSIFNNINTPPIDSSIAKEGKLIEFWDEKQWNILEDPLMIGLIY